MEGALANELVRKVMLPVLEAGWETGGSEIAKMVSWKSYILLQWRMLNPFLNRSLRLSLRIAYQLIFNEGSVVHELDKLALLTVA